MGPGASQLALPALKVGRVVKVLFDHIVSSEKANSRCLVPEMFDEGKSHEQTKPP